MGNMGNRGRLLRTLILPALMLLSGLAHAAAVQVARSAQLRLDAVIHGKRAVLYAVRRDDHTPIVGAGRVTADINGHPLPLRPDGTGYAFSLAGLPPGRQSLQVVVAHNGIHELLSGTITLPKPAPAASAFALLEQHGYGAWWVLNLVVLLLAARLIMRRKPPPSD